MREQENKVYSFCIQGGVIVSVLKWDLAIDTDSSSVVLAGHKDMKDAVERVASTPVGGIDKPHPGHDWNMPHDIRQSELGVQGCPPNCPRRLWTESERIEN